ncbi:serine hydrolase [bacterium]|nr:serine hydrolase [bacterium]
MRVCLAVVLFFCLFLNGFAQNKNTIIIEGKVFDQKNKFPLAYVSFSLRNNRIGTISNTEGAFKLVLPNSFLGDSVHISHLGYKTKMLSVSEASRGFNVFLEESEVNLDEVVISAYSANSLLRKTIQKIPENYFESPYTSQGFYRIVTRKNQNYLQLSEAVFELYHSTESEKENQFHLVKMRAIRDEKNAKGLNIGLRPRYIMESDLVNNLNSIDLLNKKGIKQHEFKLEGSTTYDGEDVYVISFDQKKGLKKARYKGKLYIDSKTFAFIHIDYSLSPRGIFYFKYGSASQRALMATMGIRITMPKNEHQISYKKIGNKYYLSGAVNDAILNFKSAQAHFDFVADSRVDYLVTHIETENVEPFQESNLLNLGYLIEKQDSPYDSTFWDDYTIILSRLDFGTIAEGLQAKNKANETKSEIESRLYKYPKDKQDRMDAILSYYNRKGLFNGNVLIENEGEILFQKSYNDSLTNNKNDTQFRIGSAGKTFTSMLTMMLEHEGKLNVNDTVGKFLPEFVHGHLSIKQLLTHQSGMSDFLAKAKYADGFFSRSYSLEEMVDKFCSDTLEFKPGTKFRYSNSGFVVLSLLIEKITQQRYGQVLQERIFNKLKMNDSYFGSPVDTVNLTIGYLYGKPEPRYFVENVGGAGGITSTTEDLLLWSRALDQEMLLPKEKINNLFVPRVAYTDWEASYGYGWMIDSTLFDVSGKHKVVYHPGTDLGFYSMFLKQPDKKITIILLNNTGDFPRFEISDLILNELN